MNYRNFHYWIALTTFGAMRKSIERLPGRGGLRRKITQLKREGWEGMSAKDFSYMAGKVGR